MSIESRLSLSRIAQRWWPLAGLPMLALVLSSLYIALTGLPPAIKPARDLFAPISIAETLAASSMAPDSRDFVFRPLLVPSRRNPVGLKPADAEAPSEGETPDQSVSVESIDGIKLLGIFNSGEVSGVFVRLEKGSRRRVDLGEALKDWELIAVSTRHALWESETGERVTLDLGFSNEQDGLAEMEAFWIEEEADMPDKSAAAQPNSGDRKAADAAALSEEASQPREMTFEAIYQRRFGRDGGSDGAGRSETRTKKGKQRSQGNDD